jgi:hypothetical protein
MPKPTLRLLCLALIFSTIVLGMCLLPVGHGPFAATYGPTSKFQALRALFVLMSLMAAALKFWDIFGCAGMVASYGLMTRKDLAQLTLYQVSLGSALRC